MVDRPHADSGEESSASHTQLSGWLRAHVLVRGTNVMVGVRSGPSIAAVDAGRFVVALAHMLAESGTTPRRLDVEIVEHTSSEPSTLPAELELRISGDVPGLDEVGLASKAAALLADSVPPRFGRLDAGTRVVASLSPAVHASVDVPPPTEPQVPVPENVERRASKPRSGPTPNTPQRLPAVEPSAAHSPSLQRASRRPKPLLIASVVAVVVIGVLATRVSLIAPIEQPGVAGVQVTFGPGESTQLVASQPTPGATRAATSVPTTSATPAPLPVPAAAPTAAAPTAAAPTAAAPTAAAPTAAVPTLVLTVLPAVAAASAPTAAPLAVGTSVPVAASASPSVRPAGPRPPTLNYVAGQTLPPRWPSDTASTAWLAQDGYHLSVSQIGQFVAVEVVPDALGDVRVTATFRKTDGPGGGGYGIIVRDQGPGPRDGLNQRGSYYVLEVGDRGEVGMWRRDQDTWVDLVPWTPNSTVRPGLGENTLMVEAQGDRLSMSVNDIAVASTADNGLRSGSIGVFLGGDQNQALLTRLTVEQLD